MLHAELIIIGLCIWSIHLHTRVRHYETGCNAMRQAIHAVAEGKAKLVRVDGAVKIQYTAGVK